tara:strand:- start:7620 stop:12647 length:5028 start_codon:yes stop_codon:yes gene_type:complete
MSQNQVDDGNNYVKEIEFVALSSEEIRSMAVVNITETMLYERGLPRMNSVLDMRMGSSDRRYVCGTCKHAVPLCPGHCGKIEMAAPVYNPVFIEITLRVLRCACFFCSGLLIEDLKIPSNTFKARRRLATISQESRLKKICPHCGGPQPNYSRVGLGIKKDFNLHKNIDSIFESEEEKSFAMQSFYPSDALSILRNIKLEDLYKLGFSKGPNASKPENFIIEVLLCPSTVMRPSIACTESSRTRGHDDLTLKLQDIVKTNSLLQSEISSEKRTPQFEKLLEQMQIHLSVYLLNDTKHAKKPGGGIRSTTIRSISTRLKGKRGRIRGNLCGKRVDFSSRSVVSPDACIDLDQIGVPGFVAEKQSIPEKVTNHNMSWLKKIVSEKKCNSILRNGRETKIKYLEEENLMKEVQRLQIGDVVERHLINNDVVLFNRQPSLHAFSLMAHRVKLFPHQKTFRLNVQATTPYNADFDGDEMNMHTLQTIEARAEAAELMSISKNLISPQASKPILGLIQDVLLGSWMLTSKSFFVNHSDAMQIVSSISGNQWLHFSKLVPAVLKPQILYSGKQLISLLLPDNLFVGPKKNKSAAAGGVDNAQNWLDDHIVLVKNGVHLCGRLDKALLGATSSGFIDILARDFKDYCNTFISEMQRLSLKALQLVGFTCSYEDTKISHECFDTVSNILSNYFKQSSKKNKEDNIINSLSTAVDKSALNAISFLRNKAQSTSLANGLLDMVDSGSKGSQINVSQISGCVGMQMVSGQRIFSTGNPEGRTIPCFEKGEHSPEAHGFVTNPYNKGIVPSEFFFHLMGGREGLVDTAVKTAQTGYISRRVSKMIESAQANYFGQITLHSGEILQPSYYGDNFSAEKIESVYCPVLQEVKLWETKKHLFTNEQNFRAAILLTRKIKKNMMKYTDVLDARIEVPVNLQRVINSKMFTPSENMDWMEELDALQDKCNSCLDLVKLHMLSVCGDRMDAGLFEVVKHKIFKARVSAGYMPGTVAAQSLSQPIMQMTLNTFHSAGKGCHLVTAGVPRLREILDGSVNISTPSMRIRLKHPINKSYSAVKRISDSFIHKPLSKYVHKVCEFLTLDSLSDYMSLTQRFLFKYMIAENSSYDDKNLVGFSFNIEKKEKISPRQVSAAIRKYFDNDNFTVIPSAFVCEEWTVFVVIQDLESLLKSKTALTTDQKHKFIHEICKSVLENVSISGNASFSQTHVEQIQIADKNTGVITSEYAIFTAGSNFRYVSQLKNINHNYTLSNNIWESYHKYGIESVQNILFRECTKVLGDGVSCRHLMLVINAMTFDGYINSINRHGMGRTRATPIQRASFEEALDVLIEACTFGTKTKVAGITECVVMGAPSTVGSGLSQLYPEKTAFVNKNQNLPFVGRRLPKAKPKAKPRPVSILDEPWQASLNFENLLAKFPNIKKGETIKLVIRGNVVQDGRFSFSILPNDHDDASEIIYHCSFRDSTQRKRFVLNDKKQDDWGKEIVSAVKFDTKKPLNIIVCLSEKIISIRLQKLFLNFTQRRNILDCGDDLFLQFESHDDYGNPMSWTINSVTFEKKCDARISQPSPPPVPKSTPTSTPNSTPPSTPSSTPRSTPNCTPPSTPNSSPPSTPNSSPPASRFGTPTSSTTSSAQNFFDDVDVPDIAYTSKTEFGDFFFDKKNYHPSSPKIQYYPSSPG